MSPGAQPITYIDNQKTNVNVSISGIGTRSDVKIRYPHESFRNLAKSRKFLKEKSQLNLSQVITLGNPFRIEKALADSN